MLERLERVHPLARTMLAFGLLQALFWGLFHPCFVTFRAEPLTFVEISRFEFAELERADRPSLASATFSEAQPAPALRSEGVFAARGKFELAEVPASGLAILNISQADNIAFYVNGDRVIQRGSMNPRAPNYRSNLTTIGHIPPALLTKGSNTISTVATISLAREVLIAPPLLADYDDATAKQGWNEFLQSDFRIITVAITFALALLIGAAALRSSDRGVAAWLFLLTTSWALYTFIPIWTTMPVHGALRGWIFAATFFLMSMAWPCFVDAWTRRPLRQFRAAMGLLFVALTGFAGLAQFGILTGGHEAVDSAIDLGGSGFVLITAARLVWHFASNPAEERVWEGAILLMLLFLSGMYLYGTIVDGKSIGLLQKTQPLLLLALGIAFFAGRFHLFRSSGEISRLLQDRLDLREAELAEAHEREKLFVREQAFGEERQRIMRDMHDGLGSQLMSMLLAARRGKVEPDRMAEGLQTVIDEMRLMIDSMDSVGESLGSAMAGFRNRLQPRIEDSGFALNWENRIEGPLPSYPPRKTLQLFRIMQEAVTNALKHSQGSIISVALDNCDGRPGWLCVTIRDDGSGITQKGRGGHGLENMRVRARSLGADIEYGSLEDGGGEVKVAIPPSPDPPVG